MATMHNPSMKSVIDQYKRIIDDNWEVTVYSGPQRANPNQPEITYAHKAQHLYWMLEEITKMEGSPDKAMRWLCFVQGALWECNLLTINEARRDNHAILNGGELLDIEV
jgi:hypothetical protein